MWICDVAESLKKVKGAATLTSVKRLLGHIHLNSRMEGDAEAILKQLEATAKSEEYEGVATLQAIKEIAATVEKGSKDQISKCIELLLPSSSNNYDSFVSSMLFLSKRQHSLGARDEAKEYILACGQKLC